MGEGRPYLHGRAHALNPFCLPNVGLTDEVALDTVKVHAGGGGCLQGEGKGTGPTISTSVRCRMSGMTCSTARHSTWDRCSFSLSYSGLPLSSPAQHLLAFPTGPWSGLMASQTTSQVHVA